MNMQDVEEEDNVFKMPDLDQTMDEEGQAKIKPINQLFKDYGLVCNKEVGEPVAGKIPVVQRKFGDSLAFTEGPLIG